MGVFVALVNVVTAAAAATPPPPPPRALAAARTSSWSGQTGNAKARRSARCRRTIEMASNSSRTSDFGQNGVLLLPLFRPLSGVHVDQEIDLPSKPEAGGDLGGCLERCFSSTPWNSSPRRLRRRYAIQRNRAPEKFLPSCVNMSRRSMPPFWEKKRCIPLVFWEREFSARSQDISGIRPPPAGCRLLGMNDRRCVIWQKSRERKRRRKDFGMMDRRRDGGVREGRRIPISIHLWESVSFSNGKTREKGRERDIEVAE